jgi:hypothetical protein
MNLPFWAWSVLCLAAYTVLVVLVLAANHEAHRVPTPQPDEIRQPDERDWHCSDGVMRTAAEAADWTAAYYGAWARHEPDAVWLPEWINEHDEPLYVPQEWVA